MLLEDTLVLVEKHIEKVSASLLAADASKLQEAADSLREAAVRFASAMETEAARGVLPATLQSRVKAIGTTLAIQRENLTRLSALVDRQAAGLLPPAAIPAATYGSAPGGRQSSAGARIYRSDS